jgi:hypothetical protein
MVDRAKHPQARWEISLPGMKYECDRKLGPYVERAPPSISSDNFVSSGASVGLSNSNR